jgi:hypothetical protein
VKADGLGNEEPDGSAAGKGIATPRVQPFKLFRRKAQWYWVS